MVKNKHESSSDAYLNHYNGKSQNLIQIQLKSSHNHYIPRYRANLNLELRNLKLHFEDINWYLRKRKHSSNINEEIGPQVPLSDLSGIHYELTATENPRAPSDESRSEFHEDVQEVEEIGDCTEEGDDSGEADVDGETRRTTDVRDVEIERIEEESEDGGDEEDVVPIGDDVAVWI